MDRTWVIGIFSKFAAVSVVCVVGVALGAPLWAQQPVWETSDPVVIFKSSLPTDPGHHSAAARLREKASRLSRKHPPSLIEGGARPSFILPVRNTISNTYSNSFALSNYVDQDMDAPDSLLDYNCGERTYDLDDGTNHNGIDYFNWPFSWLTMEQEGTAFIAAADGTIVEKNDGEPDKNCVFNDDLEANQIAIEHADGSISYYAHAKTNTLTTKGIGDSVEQGDYLGIIGSSGFSNGPHLHFGVYDHNFDLIEPHAGKCNALNIETWWEVQEEYYVPTVNHIATHSAVPEFTECPELEIPHNKDNFQEGDDVIFSVFLRDAIPGESAVATLFDPNGTQIAQFSPFEAEEHASGLMVAYGITVPTGALTGAYIYRMTFAGQVREHTWYVNSGPDPSPVATAANNAYNGLYYDPGLDGEGYNFVTAGAGTVIYFYGSDKHGNRLWLISDLITGAFGSDGAEIVVTMYESTGGTFDSPVQSARALSVWGTLTIVFTSCSRGTATLDGVDGFKISQIVKLAGVAGTGCNQGDPTSDSPWSGLYFDVGDEGEGYNLIVAPNGAILYFYGFKSNGRRLWLISDLIVVTLETNKDVEVPVFEATQGTFDSPVPSTEALVQWGTATIRLIDCTHITITIEGSDGSKVSATIKLAGVIGIDCKT